eukprot:TRINITY_DN776037_c0_g1_i1.p1 TRINITY_DN776037_c0_g1~~TRINITY_DN776037_c0_g1_i1.p1  ORF type:complete len:447 (-),score=142.61 TRINITY_DN776037_c0_g1_i1:132-1472(-)
MGTKESKLSSEEKNAVLAGDVTVEAISKKILDGSIKNVIVLAGAGISVSAGIPDFRSPSSGLYYNLKKFDLPFPEAIFEINYFRQNPKPFFTLAKELYPGEFNPTPAHFFLKILQEKGVLRRVYTQNIDTLERVAGIDPELLVEAHGSFYECHCVKCKKRYSQDWAKVRIMNDDIPYCEECGEGIVKPDITFFGESLPRRFNEKVGQDLPVCDLLIVMGTSLTVFPVAGLVKKISAEVPRILMNREEVYSCKQRAREDDEDTEDEDKLLEFQRDRSLFRFGMKTNYRDVFIEGDCDDAVGQMAECLGWKQEMEEMREEFLKVNAVEKIKKEQAAAAEYEQVNKNKNKSIEEDEIEVEAKKEEEEEQKVVDRHEKDNNKVCGSVTENELPNGQKDEKSSEIIESKDKGPASEETEPETNEESLEGVANVISELNELAITKEDSKTEK